MNSNQIQELIKKHSSYTSMLFELIKSLLKNYSIKCQVVESRTKEVKSLEDKLIRKNIKDIEKEVMDISGIRIIVYYQDDVDRVSKMIEDNFEIDYKNSSNKADLYRNNEFGYLSIHYIVLLNETRRKLPEWIDFSVNKAEIQVRTVLQHSWAAISHEITYKKEYEIPKKLQRTLFRLAGLFELADEQFTKIRDEHELLKSQIKKLSESKNLTEEKIDLLTLNSAMHSPNNIFNKIFVIALKSGLMIEDSQLMDETGYSDILIASSILRLESIKELEDILNNNISNYESYFKKIKEIIPYKYGDYAFFNLLAVLYNLNEQQLNEFGEITGWKNNFFKQLKNEILNQKT